MNKYIVCILLTFLSGFSIVEANASDDTSTAISPVVAKGVGPVINPENSQFMENKNTAVKKRLESKVHNKKHHAKKRHSRKKKN
ncbi:hypothetical protein ACOY5P_24150 [Enterobacter asburiae]|uniref:hypothetical protein n=1 Tax=Enterobacter asburiae TaxID=61645 RepID=UPI002FF446DD